MEEKTKKETHLNEIMLGFCVVVTNMQYVVDKILKQKIIFNIKKKPWKI